MMKKISNLLMMALLTIGMGLTSCDEQLDNAVDPGVMPDVEDNQTPLTLEAITAGTILIQKPQTGMQYSLNGGAKTAVTTDPIDVAVGDKVAFYGSGTSISCYGNSNPSICTKIAGGTAEVKVYGNIMSLLDETGFATATTLPATDYTFYELFSGNDKLKDANGLLLPAKTLVAYCYSRMFMGCTALTAAPALPAETLTANCYSLMFSGCTALTAAPALPAKTLDAYSYSNMFNGCTSLTTAPELPATAVPGFCYQSMFMGCTSLTTAPKLSATEVGNSSCYSMFQGCTSLTTAPELKATTLADYCYQSMFNGCTSLTTAPELPVTTLAENCYRFMFYGCTSLTETPKLPATELKANCYQEMFHNCTSLTTAYVKAAYTESSSECTNMFQGCTDATGSTFYSKDAATADTWRTTFSLSSWSSGVYPTE